MDIKYQGKVLSGMPHGETHGEGNKHSACLVYRGPFFLAFGCGGGGCYSQEACTDWQLPNTRTNPADQRKPCDALEQCVLKLGGALLRLTDCLGSSAAAHQVV